MYSFDIHVVSILKIGQLLFLESDLEGVHPKFCDNNVDIYHTTKKYDQIKLWNVITCVVVFICIFEHCSQMLKSDMKEEIPSFVKNTACQLANEGSSLNTGRINFEENTGTYHTYTINWYTSVFVHTNLDM